ncbi:hypothetical protein ACWTV9_10245 [Clostridioides difficile]|nr:hypothetical protein KW95_14020 [Clostridioides difficile]
MKIKYMNNKDDNRLYSIFLDVFEIDYTPYKTNEIDRLIIRDTIRLIDRITINECKKILGKIGIKKYTDLKEKEVKALLKKYLPEQPPERILEIHKEHQIRLDCFKYEVIEILNISKWRFNQIKHDLKVSGTQVVNISCRPKVVNKFDRRFIYEYKEIINVNNCKNNR